MIDCWSWSKHHPPLVLSSGPFCHILYPFVFSARMHNTPLDHFCQGYWYGDSKVLSKEACSLSHGWEPMLSLFAITERSTSSRQVVFWVHTINAYLRVILGYLCSRMTIFSPSVFPIYMLSWFIKSWPFHPKRTRLLSHKLWNTAWRQALSDHLTRMLRSHVHCSLVLAFPQNPKTHWGGEECYFLL